VKTTLVPLPVPYRNCFMDSHLQSGLEGCPGIQSEVQPTWLQPSIAGD